MWFDHCSDKNIRYSYVITRVNSKIICFLKLCEFDETNDGFSLLVAYSYCRLISCIIHSEKLRRTVVKTVL